MHSITNHWVSCSVCEAETAFMGTDAAAIAAWNRRAPDQQAARIAKLEAAMRHARAHIPSHYAAAIFIDRALEDSQ